MLSMILLVFIIWFLLMLASISYYSYMKEQKEMVSNIDNKIPPWRVLKQRRGKDGPLQVWFDRLAPTGKKIQLLSDPAEINDALEKAGYPHNLTEARVQGAKIFGFLAGAGIGFFYLILGLPFAPILFLAMMFAGYMGPIYLIKHRAKKRQEQISLDLPDFLDMMSITLQAGMSLDEALQYYVETNEGPLSEEFARFNQEIKFGVQREYAYRSLMNRTTSSQLETLIQSLIQAYNLGTPIAQTFTQQAEELRKMRSEKAKEAAGKAAPKISMVSGLIVGPSIMLLILAAIAYNLFISSNIFGGG